MRCCFQPEISVTFCWVAILACTSDKLTCEISDDEVTKYSKSNQSPQDGGLPSEFLKNKNDFITPYLKMYTKTTIPKHGLFLYSRKEIQRISIIHHWWQWVRLEMEQIFGKYQRGFRKEHSTIDSICILQARVQKHKRSRLGRFYCTSFYY